MPRRSRASTRTWKGISTNVVAKSADTRSRKAKTPPDKTLVQAATAGDRDAFEQIVRRYESLVYAVALGRLGRPGEAEEMVQAVFVAAYESLHRLQEPFNLSSWLARIATNLSLNRLRAGRREVSLTDVAEEGLPLREDVAPGELVRALHTLPEQRARARPCRDDAAEVVRAARTDHTRARVVSIQGG